MCVHVCVCESTRSMWPEQSLFEDEDNNNNTTANVPVLGLQLLLNNNLTGIQFDMGISRETMKRYTKVPGCTHKKKKNNLKCIFMGRDDYRWELIFTSTTSN